VSQHELSEEQARGIAVNELRRECPEFGGDVPRGWTVKAVQAGYRAGYAAANLAEAERKGAREVAEWVLEYWTLNLTIHGSGCGADRNADGGQVGVFTRKLRSYLAAPAPEGVTLSDGSVVTYNAATRIITRRLDHPQTTHDSLASYWERPVSQWCELMMHTHTGADFDALKAFAQKVGAA